MLRNFEIIIISIIILLVQSLSFSNDNFFNDALKLYENKSMMMLDFYLKEI